MTEDTMIKQAEGFELKQRADGAYEVITPAQVAVPFAEQAHAEHIFAQLTEPAAENRTLKAEKAETWQAERERAHEQYVHDLNEWAKKVHATMREKRARGQRLTKD